MAPKRQPKVNPLQSLNTRTIAIENMVFYSFAVFFLYSGFLYILTSWHFPANIILQGLFFLFLLVWSILMGSFVGIALGSFGLIISQSMSRLLLLLAHYIPRIASSLAARGKAIALWIYIIIAAIAVYKFANSYNEFWYLTGVLTLFVGFFKFRKTLYS